MPRQKDAIQADSGPIVVHPLTPAHWNDLVALFGANGACAGCWDIWYRIPSREYNAGTGEQHRDAFRARVETGPPPGLLAYRGADVAGWCALGPRADFPRLEKSKVFAPVDATPAWLIVCFFTRREHRNQGVAHALLRAALDYAVAHGAPAVEACAVEPVGGQMPAAFAFPGPVALYRAAGFREIARRSPTRPLMRYDLG